jgi:hypothetical protein
MQAGSEELDRLDDAIANALKSGDLSRASSLAAALAALRYGLPGTATKLGGVELAPRGGLAVPLSIGKLKHDIDQLRYLYDQGDLAYDEERIAALGQALDRLTRARIAGQTSATLKELSRLGAFYGRRLHAPTVERVARSLSDAWLGADVEAAFLDDPLAPVVIDSFLSQEAVEGLRRFCLRSTFWNANRYANERLGVFFRDGFHSPLLTQIAEELRARMPRVLADHPLRQLWAFKYRHAHPADTTHADFAAVNVNFWITPESANLDPSSGGLVVYRAEAPMDWSFAAYNRDVAAIHAHLQEVRAPALRIPYRENRAVVFCSDLFHSTDAVTFRPGYENRRINVTMLFGDRGNARRAASSFESHL